MSRKMDALKAEVLSGEFKILKVYGLELAGESFIIFSNKRPLQPLAREFLEILRSTRTKDSLETRSKSSNVQGSNGFTAQPTASGLKY